MRRTPGRDGLPSLGIDCVFLTAPVTASSLLHLRAAFGDIWWEPLVAAFRTASTAPLFSLLLLPVTPM